MANVAFLGLGVMGFPMAGWLARKGHTVTVYNRTAAKAERWCTQYAGKAAATPAAAAQGAEIVFSCVGDDPDLRDIALGSGGVIAAMRAGSIYVDHTTASADVAREIAAAGLKRGVHCLDAPVSGGQAGAENGKLTVMVGGEAGPFATAEPVIRSFAHAVRLIGPAGSGQLTKMVNQIAIAGVVQGLAEALNFARKAGLDVAHELFDTISKRCRAIVADGEPLEDDERRQVRLRLRRRVDAQGLADLLAGSAQQRRGVARCGAVDQFYADVVGMGGKRWDTSSLIARLNRHEKK